MGAKVTYERYEQVHDELSTFAEACAVAVEKAAETNRKVIITDNDGTTFLISAVHIEDAS